MKTSNDQYCINVSDLEKSVHFYETVLGLEVTHRIEIPKVSEVVLAGANGHRIQLAKQHEDDGPIQHWPVAAAFVRDPDGYQVEILQHHGETPADSGPGSS